MLELLLARTASFLGAQKVDYMVIGGFALPSYGAIRATVDLDVAVKIMNKREFAAFMNQAEKSGFKSSVASFSNPVNVLQDVETGLEIELWLRPDGIRWDEETLRRRRKAKIGEAEVWLVSPEDFIVSKLSRPDRGAQDEKDAKSVLSRLQGSIDKKYLDRRATAAGVRELLRAIERV